MSDSNEIVVRALQESAGTAIVLDHEVRVVAFTNDAAKMLGGQSRWGASWKPHVDSLLKINGCIRPKVKGPVRHVMRRAGVWDELGADHIFLDVHSAVQSIRTEGDGGGCETVSGCAGTGENADTPSK